MKTVHYLIKIKTNFNPYRTKGNVKQVYKILPILQKWDNIKIRLHPSSFVYHDDFKCQ